MTRSVEVTDTTVVIRPAPSTMWLWLLVFATGLNWMFWKFAFCDSSRRALWFLLLPSLALVAAVIDEGMAQSGTCIALDQGRTTTTCAASDAPTCPHILH